MFTRALLISLMGLLLAVPCRSQTTVPDEPACAQCEIVLRGVVDIGVQDGGESLPGRPIAVTADRRGRYWLSFEGGDLKVFDRSGRFLQQVGRFGEGPREYRAANVLTTAGDSVIVFDMGNGRATVIAPDFRVVRMIRMPTMVRAAAVLSWPSKVVLNGWAALDDAARPLQLADLTGDEAHILRVFGPPENSGNSSGQRRLARSLVITPDATIWSSDRAFQYRLAAWTGTGEPSQVLAREPIWMAGANSLGGRNAPPPPYVWMVRADRPGNLWVFALTPGRNWRDAWLKVPRMPRGIGEIRVGALDESKLYQTTLEVISPRTRRVLARKEFTGQFIAAGDSLIASYIESDDGTPRVRILTYELRQPKRM